MFCPACGKPVDDTDAFCRACAKPLHATTSNAAVPIAVRQSNPKAPKNMQIIGFLLAFAGGFWACSYVADSRLDHEYTWPAMLFMAGIAIWISGRFTEWYESQ